MFATSFQLAGALLFGYMIAFRKKKQIIISSSTSVFVKGIKPRIAEDKWIETFGYRIGFLYIAIGYLLPLIEKEFDITLIEGIFIIFLIVSILIIAGIGFSNILGKREFDKMTPEDFFEGSPDGAMMVTLKEEE